ncbi:hypothetical protein BV20DRAFT_1121148 [Pilatotrama ljubarskyi]|nr:hypothetical protein BV20DRAFT_1121148 [Pilatotrama ljubarskyi]
MGKKYWPPNLTNDSATIVPLLIKHFSITLLGDTGPEERVKLKAILTAHPFAPEAKESAALAVLPPVPPAVRDVDHPFVLGWAYTNAWWKLFYDVSKEVTFEQDPAVDWSTYSTTLSELCRRSNCHDSLFSAWGVRADMPVWDDNTSDEYWLSLPVTGLFAICCTANHFLYRRRPTEKQYQWLKMVLGEPTWYRWPFSLETFQLEDLIQ